MRIIWKSMNYVKEFDSIDLVNNMDIIEENQSELQKISSTLCMRQEAECDESENES